MNKLQSIIESPLAALFGQTMLHSLWQGVIIVTLYLISSRFLKKADHKVWAGLSAFGLQVLASVITFTSLSPGSAESLTQANQATSVNVYFTTLLQTSSSMSVLETIQAHANWLTLGWIIGFVFLMLRHVGGLAYVQFLKSSGITSLNQKAQEALSGVLNKIQGKAPAFEAYLSDRAGTAMVLGHIKPVLLLPVALTTNLSSSQLELIIAHEIAHIRRNDFLINLLQTLVENLFFYHPAFWLVSYQIRENREHACDDWAAELTGNRVLLAKTLAQIQLSQQHPSLAMAFGKKRMPMLSRIQRLLGINPKQHRVKLTATLLMLAVVSTIGFVQAQSENEISLEPISENEEVKIINEIPPEEEIATAEALPDTDIVNHHIYYGFGDEDIELKNDTYAVKIDQDRIVINGKEQNLSPAQKQALKEHWKGIQTAKEDLDVKVKNIQIETDKLQDLHTEIMAKMPFNPADDPQFKEKIAAIQIEAKEIQKYAEEFQSEMKKLDPKDKAYEEKMDKLSKSFESKIKVHEEKMEKLDLDMKDFDVKMKDFEVKMEKELEIPMSKIEQEIEFKTEGIEAMAEEVETHHDAILELLPEDVRKSFGNMSKPPKPPKPEKPMKPMKPEKPAKEPKVPAPPKPVSPPAPPRID